MVGIELELQTRALITNFTLIQTTVSGGLLLKCARAGPFNATTHLHSGLGQVGAHSQTLTHHHVRVVGLLEGLLQGLQLLRREGRATAPLFSVLGAVASLKDDVLKCAAVEKQKRDERV